MKTTRHLRTVTLALALLALPFSALAQTSGGSYTRRAGEREFTLGAAGASNRDFDSSFGGVNVSLGQYTNDNAEWVLRQSLNYSNPDVGGRTWAGATRIAFDYHFPTAGAIRPFVGANAGGIYGDAIRDSFAAGLEAGAKFYVQPRTFVFAMAEWAWTFRQAKNLSNSFSSGQYNWSAGVGFNF